jgi:hypothetical protein
VARNAQSQTGRFLSRVLGNGNGQAKRNGNKPVEAKRPSNDT